VNTNKYRSKNFRKLGVCLILLWELKVVLTSRSRGSLVGFGFALGFLDKTSLSLSLENGISFGESSDETGVETVESLGALSLLSLSSLGSGVLDSGSSGGNSSFLGSGLSLNSGVSVGVKSLHHVSVVEGVLLGLVVSSDGSLDGTEFSLNLIRVDNSGEVSALHGGTVESVSSLLDTSLVGGSEDGIELLEGSGGVDDESTEVTTGSELEEVKSVDVASVNSGEVSSVVVDVGILVVVDDKGTLSHGESGVSHLTLTVSGGLGSTDSSEIVSGTVGLERVEHGLGGVSRVDVGNEGELGDGINFVSSGEDEGSASRGSEASSDGVSLLVGVDLSVPFSPGSERGEHASLSAHVTESGLSSSGGTRSGNSRNTGDSTSSSPRLSRVHVSLEVEDSMSLSSVLSHVGVAERDDIVTDGGTEDGGHGFGSGDGSFFVGARVDGNGRTGGHIVRYRVN